MFVPVTVKVNGSTEYNRGFDLVGEKLTAFARQAGDMTEPLSAIGDSILLNVSTNMYSQGAGGWQPLSIPYGPWKQEHVPGVPMLWGLRPLHKGTRQHPTRPETYAVSGAMARSLMDPASVHVTPKRMSYTPESPIAGWHETGTSKMPARPPVLLTPTMLHSWDREFVTWLDRLIQEQDL